MRFINLVRTPTECCIFLALVLLPYAAFGLKCYTCHSNTTMDDCDKNRNETECGSSDDRCGETTAVHNSLKKYKKFCATEALCERLSDAMQYLQQCHDPGATCKAYCCDEDLCNDGSAPTAAFRLKCYTCSSETSMDDCDKNRKETDCGSSYDRCGKMTYEDKPAKRYKKFCTTKAFCKTESSAKKECPEGATCKADCCDGDLCNGGAAPMIGVLLMVACALVAFFR